MVFITQLIYLREGTERTFSQFEDLAIPLISKYHGRLLLRIRPDEHSFVEANMERPYEIHLAEFPTEADFMDFMQDEERKRFLYLKEESIRSVILIKGTKL